MTRKFLDDVYGTAARADITAFYDEWAATYEAELADNTYVTPERIARMLAQANVPADARILDYGCGTGLGGTALRSAGFTNLTGTDPSEEMLAQAIAKGVYHRTWQTDLAASLPITASDFDVIAAIGVVSPGAAPAQLLDVLADLVAPGGYLTWSFNGHGLEDPEYIGAKDALIARPDMTLLAEEHGPHLPGRGLESTIYLLRRD